MNNLELNQWDYNLYYLNIIPQIITKFFSFLNILF